jgi:hypothetical protein
MRLTKAHIVRFSIFEWGQKQAIAAELVLTSRDGDLNPGPTVYETVALPLSYPGMNTEA